MEIKRFFKSGFPGAAVIMAMVLMLPGCGSLNQKVGGPQLTDEAMEYAKKMPASSSTMEISFNGKSPSTSRWAQKVYPIFPLVYYWYDFGEFGTPPPNYGVRTETIIFPMLWVMRDSAYNENGERINAETSFNLVFAIGYEDRITPDSSDFKVGILWIPGIGPFLGAGPEFFQFFWVPFSNYK